MKRSLFKIFMALMFIAPPSFAQVARTSIVEHFTNTSCSICATNNEGYYDIIDDYPNALHISFHPSSPYVSDVFSQQNLVENDARTNYYGVFGSTPRLVVNGSVIQSLGLNTALMNASSTLSNFELKIYQEQVAATSFDVSVVIRKVANDTTTLAILFLGAMEDTIYQTTNNGETTHYNVFRKSLTATTGNSVQLPISVGDSTVAGFNFTALSNWNTDRIHSIGILQRSDKTVINSFRSINSTNIVAGLQDEKPIADAPFLFPNPTTTNGVYSYSDLNEIKVYTASGKLVKSIGPLKMNEQVIMGDLSPGLYLLIAKDENGIYRQKLIFQ